jgi:hypothetical protein
MVSLYEARGLPHDEAELVVGTMAKHRDFFVDVTAAAFAPATPRICSRDMAAAPPRALRCVGVRALRR